MRFTRISKREAKKRFTKGEIIYLCPRKTLPGFPWNMACLVSPQEWLEKADIYVDGHLWKGNREETAWSLMYNNWHYYNASHETGYYAHYYVETP